MYYGIKNSKRFKMSILTYLIMLMATFASFGCSMSDGLFSLIDNRYMPDKSKLLLVIGGLTVGMAAVIKTEIISGQLNVLKGVKLLIYFLMNNCKSKHKLTESNYKKSAIFCRIIQTFGIDYSGSVLSILTGFILLKISILLKKLGFILFSIIQIFDISLTCYLMVTWVSFLFILFLYYKLLFNQIHHQVI